MSVSLPAVSLPAPRTAPGVVPDPRQTYPHRSGTYRSGLLELLARGDDAAWRDTVARFERLVRSRVRSFRLQPADADDAVAATWLRLAQNADKIQDVARLPGWLSTVAGRECLRILDRTAHAGIPTDDAGASVPDPEPGPEQRALDADVAAQLHSLVATLPRRRRLLVAALFGDEGWSYERISRVTGIPTGSIGPTRARALEQLRRMVSEQGIDVALRPVPAAPAVRVPAAV